MTPRSANTIAERRRADELREILMCDLRNPDVSATRILNLNLEILNLNLQFTWQVTGRTVGRIFFQTNG